MSITKLRVGLLGSVITISGAMIFALPKKNDQIQTRVKTTAVSQIRQTANKDKNKIYEIRNMPARFNSYEEIKSLMQDWSHSAPQISESISYGKTSLGTSVDFLRIGTKDKPKILIQSGLAADEELGVLENLKLAEKILSRFGKDSEVTWLVNNRDIYFVPVVSPDNFLQNSDFERKNTAQSFPSLAKLNPDMPPSVKLLIEFVQANKFSATLNFHTYGDFVSLPNNSHEKDFLAIHAVAQKMADLSGYKIKRSDKESSDLEWLYSSGCFSMDVMWGCKDRKFVSYSDIDSSMDRMFDSLALFMKEAPEARLNPTPLPSMHFYQGD